MYFASVKREGSVVPEADDESVPGWLEIGTGVALGLGIGMVLVWAIARRARRTTGIAA